MDIFSKNISVWESVHRTHNPSTFTLHEFLSRGLTHKAAVLHCRQVYNEAVNVFPANPEQSDQLFREYKRLKKSSLPVAAIGGVFTNSGRLENLLEPSNLLCIDIDQAKPREAERYRREGKPIPNSWVGNWESVKYIVSKLPFVGYAALSVSGHGLYCVIPIKDSNKHAEHWEALNQIFASMNLTIDPQTRDLTRTRFISFDERPYTNPHAVVFEPILQPPKPRETSPQKPLKCHSGVSLTEMEKTERLVREIERRAIDVTADYGVWIKLAGCFYNEFGESGYNYFKRVSSFYPGADEKEIARQWRHSKIMRTEIGYFYQLCAQHGIRYDTTSYKAVCAPETPKVGNVSTESEKAVKTAENGLVAAMCPQHVWEIVRKKPAVALLADKLDLELLGDTYEPF